MVCSLVRFIIGVLKSFTPYFILLYIMSVESISSINSLLTMTLCILKSELHVLKQNRCAADSNISVLASILYCL